MAFDPEGACYWGYPKPNYWAVVENSVKQPQHLGITTPMHEFKNTESLIN